MAKKKTKKEAREESYSRVLNRLYKLIDKSRTFDEFKYELQGSKWWYLGNPIPQQMRGWTWREFQELFNKRKGIS